MAAVDYFLKIDGIPGESQDARHKDEIDLESFAWAEDVPTSASGGGATGKVHIHDFQFTMRFNKASPLLFVTAASGRHLRSAVLAGRRAGGLDQDFLTITLTGVRVTAFATGASAGDDGSPVDQVSLGFEQIVVEYRPQRPDGALDDAVRAGWDVAANRPI